MKNMWKALYGVLLCSMIVGLCACGSDEASGDNKDVPTATATPTPAQVENTNPNGLKEGRKYSIPVYVDIKLEEYEEATNQVGSVVENQIYCGKRYKMTLDSSVYGRDNLGAKELELEYKVAFNQGDSKLTEFYYVNESGYDFTKDKTEPGVHTARAKISQTTALDFSKGYFVIGVDYINETERSASQQLTVEVKPVLPDDSKDIVKIKINNVLENKLTNYVTILKGDFGFTYKENISFGIGRGVEETTVKIKCPEQCEGITIAFFDDEKRQVHYGTTKVLSPKKGEDTIFVVLADYMKEYKGGEAEYEEMLDNGAKKVYLTVTALGGDSYNDAKIDMEYTFE